MAVGGKDTNWQHGTHGATSSLTDYTSSTMSVNPSFNAEEADATTFGNAYRDYEQTFKNSTIEVTYKYSTTVFGQLFAIWDGGDSVDFQLGPTGITTGNAKITGAMVITKIDPPVTVGDIIKFNVSFRVNGTVTYATFA